nr:capsid protein [Trichopteran jingmen-related virus]
MQYKIVFLICLIHVTINGEETVNSEELSDCGKYNEDWRISQCASSLKQKKLISKFLYNNYLDMAKTKGASFTKYYSVGVAMGLENKFIAGTINDPKFETMYGFNIDPASLYFDIKLIDMGVYFDKPVALFLLNNVQNVPEWDSEFLSKWQKTGKDEVSSLYKAAGAGVIDINSPENCGKYEKWINDHLTVRKQGVAIQMGPSLWCPIVRDGTMEIVVAETHDIQTIGMDGMMVKMTVVKSAVWATGTFGKPTEAMKKVFQ